MFNAISYYKGLFCEFLTILIYSLMLYRFRGWRVKNCAGEIDLIFSYNDLYVFIEVKYRRGGLEQGSLSAYQLSRIQRASSVYLGSQDCLYPDMRFDFVIYTGFFIPKIYYNISST